MGVPLLGGSAPFVSGWSYLVPQWKWVSECCSTVVRERRGGSSTFFSVHL